MQGTRTAQSGSGRPDSIAAALELFLRNLFKFFIHHINHNFQSFLLNILACTDSTYAGFARQRLGYSTKETLALASSSNLTLKIKIGSHFKQTFGRLI